MTTSGVGCLVAPSDDDDQHHLTIHLPKVEAHFIYPHHHLSTCNVRTAASLSNSRESEYSLGQLQRVL